MRTGIYNAKIVCRDGIIEGAGLVVQDGIIEGICDSADICGCIEAIDAGGNWLMPGMIDLHNDAIETEAEPRPGAHFPIDIAFLSLESRLASNGITTIFHSFSCIEGKKEIRELDRIISNIEAVNRLKNNALIRHMVHARYDITETRFADPLERFIREGKVHFLSFMDHTPGQGQYRNIEVFIDYLEKHQGIRREHAYRIVDERRMKGEEPGLMEYIERLARLAAQYGLKTASHDDDSPSKITMMKSLGVEISEFPVDRISAEAARKAGMHIVCGAPNVLRGISNSGNMRVIDAIRDGNVDILCSDYLPGSMLHAIFKLYSEREMPLWESVNMVTLNPAKILGIDMHTGSIEAGKQADFILVNDNTGLPFVEKVYVNGEMVLDRLRISFTQDPAYSGLERKNWI